MHSWNMGYDTDTNYNYGYFTQLNPYALRFNFLSQGLAFPDLGPNTTACELGFGNGISVIMHAAASPIKWYGNDFNPSQVNFAKLLAERGGVKVDLRDDAFDQFLNREDVPMFDYICLHGIWSWISAENQDVIVEFVRKKLKVGGILYVSYNVGPGFSIVEPYRYLIWTYVNNLGDPSLNHIQKLPQALEFVDKLLKLDPGYSKAAPWSIENYKKRIVEADHNYVGHEFLNSNWFIEHFNVIADKFETAKLSFVCQSRLMDNFDDIIFKEEEREVLKQYVNTPLYQPVRDYIISQTFRCDVYSKGVVKLSNKQQLKCLDETFFILTQYHKGNEFTFNCRLGAVPVDLDRIKNIMQFMSDYKVHSFKQMREALSLECDDGKNTSKNALKRIPEEELFSNLVYAVASGMITVAIDPSTISQETINTCKALNQHILQGNQDESICALASPVTGGGYYIDDIEKILINLVLKLKGITEKELSNGLLSILDESATITLKGKVLSDPKEIQEKVKVFVHEFLVFKMPLYKNLMII